MVFFQNCCLFFSQILGNQFPALQPLEDSRIDLLKEFIKKSADVTK